jgi:fructose-bisphosphate aldolase class I
MFDETLRQSTEDGKPFAELLKERGIITGIKVDKGVKPIAGTEGETATQGIDDLDVRCAEYYSLGARFAKWRAVLKIDVEKGCPSVTAITENAHNLARYASICQANGLVPIVEPEVLCDGTHSIEDCAKATERVMAGVTKALADQGVLPEGMLLKPNMVTSGKEATERAGPAEVAWYTVRTFGRTLVPNVPGVVFLSGGQSEEEASVNLSAINALKDVPKPWALTFSSGRALQASAIAAWEGKPENKELMQKVLVERAQANSKASLGTYEGGSGSTADLHVSNYAY